MPEPNIGPDHADTSFMRRALELAAKGEGSVEPNPMVGCVLVRDHQIIGEGYHRFFGGPHAEIDALRSLASESDASGATAYVTLEPCCHHGKTPPCSKALIDAGVARVVVAMPDPFPQVDGGGIQQLRDAGIEIEMGVLQSDAESLNAPYLKRVRDGLPWVIAKWAMTIDGKIAAVTGDSQWITSPASREDAHRLRARVDAIAVGMGTVVDDDPMLNARIPDGEPARTARRIVFCRQRIPERSSKLIRTAREIPVVLVLGKQIAPNSVSELENAGVETVVTETDDKLAMVRSALRWMGDQGMTNLMLEGGSQLLASFFECGQIDEAHVYLGAKAIGGRDAPGPIGGVGVDRISDATAFRLTTVDVLQHDLKVVYRRFNRE